METILPIPGPILGGTFIIGVAFLLGGLFGGKIKTPIWEGSIPEAYRWLAGIVGGLLIIVAALGGSLSIGYILRGTFVDDADDSIVATVQFSYPFDAGRWQGPDARYLYAFTYDCPAAAGRDTTDVSTGNSFATSSHLHPRREPIYICSKGLFYHSACAGEEVNSISPDQQTIAVVNLPENVGEQCEVYFGAGRIIDRLALSERTVALPEDQWEPFSDKILYEFSIECAEQRQGSAGEIHSFDITSTSARIAPIYICDNGLYSRDICAGVEINEINPEQTTTAVVDCMFSLNWANVIEEVQLERQ